jgi:type I restriction enzyme S subunit
VSLGENATIIPGYAFSSSDFVSEGAPLIRMGNLYQNRLSLNRAPKYMPLEFIDKHSKFVVRANDIVFSMTGTSGKEDYGFAVKVPVGAPICLLNQRVAKVVAGKEVNMNFLLNLMRSRLFLDEIYALGAGTKQANLSSANILCIVLPFPQIEEQIKIANALDSVSDRMSAINTKLQKLKNTKKALMQDLLTGKVRVTLN